MAKILIVDDDPDVVEVCRVILERDRHEVRHAHSREEGLRAIAESKPDLLILDVMMEYPDDGLAMAQELRRQTFDRPILMLSSIGRATGMSFGRDDAIVPVDAFLTKPVDASTLLAKVDELLAKKGG